MINFLGFAILLGCLMFSQQTYSQKPPQFLNIAYYVGNDTLIDKFELQKLTHIIYSFGHLKANEFYLGHKKDTLTLFKLSQLKKSFPNLKILVSLGGWGGCKTCSDIFSTETNRQKFALTVKNCLDYFNIDGIDLDWEYPGLPSLPDHGFKPEDKQNFTKLVEALRQTLGTKKEISFAVGGFKKAIDSSIELDKVMPLVDRIHIMSYDLYDMKKTGLHTSLHSKPQQQNLSADYMVQYLIKNKVPKYKIIIGAAFYGRLWRGVPNINNGLYQSGLNEFGYAYKDVDKLMPIDSGYIRFYDDSAQLAYTYNPHKKIFMSFDNLQSVKAKTNYVKKLGLGGIMFWELTPNS